MLHVAWCRLVFQTRSGVLFVTPDAPTGTGN
jgi:hypothetical protein